ncbi:MAG: hypothetical protein JNG88_10755 [Phycisphaerales bacterium]|nr:hypothetical protein [Phycisphaerales bacterium]
MNIRSIPADLTAGRQIIVHVSDSACGPRPLAIVSHGTGGNRFAYATLGRHLAAAGYVVVHPTHAGSDDAAMKLAPGRRIDRIRALMADANIWRSRAADIRAVIDAVGTHPVLRERVDPSRVGVVGHSYGAHTAMTIGGMLVVPQRGDAIGHSGQRGCAESLRDARVRAVAALSPPSVGRLGIEPGAWREMTTPLLVMTGTLDAELDIGDYSKRRIAYDESRGPACYVLIDGADHLTFADYAPAGNRSKPPDPRHVFWVHRACEMFFNGYVCDDSAALDWMTRHRLQVESAGICTVEHHGALTTPNP